MTGRNHQQYYKVEIVHVILYSETNQYQKKPNKSIGQMADSFNTYFPTVCAQSETDNSNVPRHSVYLSNPPNTTFKFGEIDNRTVLQSNFHIAKDMTTLVVIL